MLLICKGHRGAEKVMNVLVTGSSGYIATNMKQWLEKQHSDYTISNVSVRDVLPDLTGYHAVIHTAALVHAKETNENKQQFYEINSNLTQRLARKAKDNGVKQFIFLSTMAVYGKNGSIKNETIITSTTKEDPQTNYAKSKLLAEQYLEELNDECFKVYIIRPPVIYGTNCPGNYGRLERLANTLPIFPNIQNKRSMLHVSNLCQLVHLILESNSEERLFFPQDRDYYNTSLLFQKIRKRNGKHTLLNKTLGRFVTLFNLPVVNKVFGTLIYDKKMSEHFNNMYLVH